MMQKPVNKKILSMVCITLLLTTMSFIGDANSSFSLNDSPLLYVDDDNIEGPWDGTIDHPYQQVNDALRQATNTSSIYVFSGTYTESLFINKNVNITGENRNETILIGSVFFHQTHNAKLSECTITANVDEGAETCGITFNNTQNTIVINCVITNHHTGFLLSEQSSTSIIKQNLIEYNDIGIDVCTSSDNLIYANTIQENENTNIILYHSDNNFITQNIIRNAEHNLQFHTSKDIISQNYWGDSKNVHLFFGYKTIKPINVVIPWIKLLVHSLTDINQQSINPLANMQTSLGSMVFQLYHYHLPITVQNFIDLANIDFFGNIVFHRVIDDFVIQGGGYDINGKPKESPFGTIPLETHPEVTHVDGAISMARTSDPDSATSQFFICDGTQPGLDGNYAAFGKLLVGFDTLRTIASVETTRKHFMDDWPVEDVVIIDAEII